MFRWDRAYKQFGEADVITDHVSSRSRTIETLVRRHLIRLHQATGGQTLEWRPGTSSWWRGCQDNDIIMFYSCSMCWPLVPGELVGTHPWPGSQCLDTAMWSLLVEHPVRINSSSVWILDLVTKPSSELHLGQELEDHKLSGIELQLRIYCFVYNVKVTKAFKYQKYE